MTTVPDPGTGIRADPRDQVISGHLFGDNRLGGGPGTGISGVKVCGEYPTQTRVTGRAVLGRDLLQVGDGEEDLQRRVGG